jgi:hypothetical protein
MTVCRNDAARNDLRSVPLSALLFEDDIAHVSTPLRHCNNRSLPLSHNLQKCPFHVEVLFGGYCRFFRNHSALPNLGMSKFFGALEKNRLAISDRFIYCRDVFSVLAHTRSGSNVGMGRLIFCREICDAS